MSVCLSYMWRFWRRKSCLILFFLMITMLLVSIQLTSTSKKHASPDHSSFHRILPSQRLHEWNGINDDSRVQNKVKFLPRRRPNYPVNNVISDDQQAVNFEKAQGHQGLGEGQGLAMRLESGLVAPEDLYKRRPIQREQMLKFKVSQVDGAEYDQPGAQQVVNVVPQVYNPGQKQNFADGDKPLYIPEKRFIHFDLKGAPPKIDYMIKVLKLAARLGANGVLIEYEDTFPFMGRLASTAAINHYNMSDIQQILDTCRQLRLEVIPLVQTFGHMEFILKLKEFAHLRDNEEMPESICSCHDQAMPLIKEYIDQVMAAHPGVTNLHVGCDEVYHMGECPPCLSLGLSRTDLFVRHVENVAKYVKERYPGVTVLIWDDMLRNFMASEMKPLANLVEPMVWIYAEDVYRFMPSFNWDKLAEVFDTVWTASAFKGAHGPTLTVPPMEKHLTNTLNWLNVMGNEASKFKKGLRGIVATGWQRYDHFAVLCEILPVSIPSLAVNLIALEHGYFNSTLKNKLYDGLECASNSNLATSDQFKTFIDLVEDPYLWNKMSWCFFPGTQAFKLTQNLEYVTQEVKAYVEKVKQEQGWLTDFSVRRNYSSPFRVNEGLEELPSHIYSVTSLGKMAKQSLEPFFDDYTVAEWIEQKVYPLYHELQKIKNDAENLKKRNRWERRPFSVNPALGVFGIGVQNLPSSQSIVFPPEEKERLVEQARKSETPRPKRLVQQPDYYRNPPSVVIGA